MFNVGDKITVSDKWLEVCGRLAYSGKPWTVTRVQLMVGDERMYHVEAEDGRTWSVWSIRGVAKYVGYSAAKPYLNTRTTRTIVKALRKDIVRNAINSPTYEWKGGNPVYRLCIFADLAVVRACIETGDKERARAWLGSARWSRQLNEHYGHKLP